MRGDRSRALLAGAWWTVGGAVWTAHAVLLALRPVGCIAEQCRAVGSHRITEDLLWFFAIAVACLAIGMFTAAIGPERRGNGFRLAALVLTSAGVAAVIVGLGMNAVTEDDSPLWWLHDSDSLGRALPVFGSVAAGVAALLGRWLRPWLGALLILASLICLGFNAQTERVLLAVPLGVAWSIAGVVTMTTARRTAVAEADPAPTAGPRGESSPS